MKPHLALQPVMMCHHSWRVVERWRVAFVYGRRQSSLSCPGGGARRLEVNQPYNATP